ncbi:MAG: hypothetical protein V1880_01160 [Patescibacteria group bacterium]
MNVRRDNVDHPVDHPKDDAGSGSLEAHMSVIEGMPAEERRLTYRECAKFLLIRYLVEKKLVEGPLSEEECRPAIEELEAENADGICYLFYVRGSVWDVILTREEGSKKAIEENPDRLNDPELFVMDFRKAAKVSLRNSDFHK